MVSFRHCTYAYASPQLHQATRYRPDHNDRWSLGASLYFVASKIHLFQLVKHDSNYDFNEEIINHTLDQITPTGYRDILKSLIVIDEFDRVDLEEVLKLDYFSK